MRSLGRTIANLVPLDRTRTPVSYAKEATARFPLFGHTDHTTELESVSQVPTLYSCVNRLATSVADADWNLWTKPASGLKEERQEIGDDHPAAMLWEQPNPFTSRMEHVEASDQHLELTGSTYWIIGSDDRMPDLPTSLWVVRPDRMEPVTSPTEYLTGAIYMDPDGRQVPFSREQVIHIKFPDPLDPYHGLGPLRSLLVDLDASRFASQYTRNVFLNSAQPGGVIESQEPLSREEFDELNARWNEQHRGVGNAHRVAVLSHGLKWQDRAFSMRDLQYPDLVRVGDERIMLAFGLSKTLLGQTENVNRATAEAAEYIFGKYQIRPRLKRIRYVLNRRILSNYAFGDRMEFDFEDPVTGNVEEEAKDRESRVNSAVALIDAGFHPDDVAEMMDLPEMRFVGKQQMAVPEALPAATETPALPAADDDDEDEETADETANRLAGLITRSMRAKRRHWSVRPRNADDPPDLDPLELPSVARLQTTFDEILDRLIEQWSEVEGLQKEELLDAVLTIANSGTIDDLADLAVDTEAAEALLVDAMEEIAADAAEAMAEEAAEQGVTLDPVTPKRSDLRAVAVVVASLTAGRLISSAASTAMRANGPTVTAEEVLETVDDALTGLSPDVPRLQLGAALTGTQNEARMLTAKKGPSAAFYANEVNDVNTCGPCREVNGKWLGNTEDLDEIYKLYPGGAYGGYVGCDGRERCRGTITAIWRR